MKTLDFGGSKNQKKTKKYNEIIQMLNSGALDDTKTIGKAGSDIFAKSGPRLCSLFFQGFAGPDFAKISELAFPIVLVSSRAPETNI